MEVVQAPVSRRSVAGPSQRGRTGEERAPPRNAPRAPAIPLAFDHAPDRAGQAVLERR